MSDETKMDPKLKREWIEALRSGKYEQHRGSLSDGAGKLCCLGVLALIKTGEVKCLYWREILGADQAPLARMNDGRDEYDGNPHTFAQIADHIEANL